MTTLQVACVQMRSGKEVGANIAAAEVLIRRAAGEGARLIATPEMTSLLDRTPGAVQAAARTEADDPALAHFRALARELGVSLLIGSLPIRPDGDSRVPARCWNRSYLLGSGGEIVARYDKIHMFDVHLGSGNVYRESDTFEAGQAAVVADAEGARLGLTICYDMRFPHLYRDLAKAGAQAIAAPSAFTRVTGEAHWHVLLRARAIETGCFLLAPAQGGRHEDGRETYGHSLIVAPWGEIVAEAAHVEPGVLTAALDLSQADEARRKIPALSHDRTFHPPGA